MNLTRRSLALSLAVTALLCGTMHAADQAAIAFDVTQLWSVSSGTGIYGWQFTANSDMQISALGIFDNANVFGGGVPGDGLLEAHTVAVWDVASHLDPLLSAIVPAGTGAPLVNGFRYVNAGPALLLAGHDYVIAATYAEQDWVTGDYNNLDFTLAVNPELAYGGSRSGGGMAGSLGFPDTLTADHVFGFGPNFTYTNVPEPSTLAIGFVATVGLVTTKKGGKWMALGARAFAALPPMPVNDRTGGARRSDT